MNANDNPSQYQPIPPIKRGPGRPRGSKNRAKINVPRVDVDKILIDPDSATVDLDALFNALPPLNMSAAERREALRVIDKNTSLRLSLDNPDEARAAVFIIWYTQKHSAKKATFVKDLFMDGLRTFMKDEDERRKVMDYLSKIPKSNLVS